MEDESHQNISQKQEACKFKKGLHSNIEITTQSPPVFREYNPYSGFYKRNGLLRLNYGNTMSVRTYYSTYSLSELT